MKKILMVVTFLLMVAMVPVAHATLYTLEADDIWFDTGIVLAANQSITFSGGQTHTNWSEILKANKLDSNVFIGDININDTNVWTPITGSDGNQDYIRDQWTWGIGYFTSLQGKGHRDRVWTGADGGYGGYTKYGSDNIGADEWFKDVDHGALIGYIGTEKPLLHIGYLAGNGHLITDPIPLDGVFGIGTVSFTKSGTGTLWIGMNDDFVDYIYGVKDNFGYAKVNIQVPEPASMLLLFFGLMGVLGLRRKFKS